MIVVHLLYDVCVWCVSVCVGGGGVCVGGCGVCGGGVWCMCCCTGRFKLSCCKWKANKCIAMISIRHVTVSNTNLRGGGAEGGSGNCFLRRRFILYKETNLQKNDIYALQKNIYIYTHTVCNT